MNNDYEEIYLLSLLLNVQIEMLYMTATVRFDIYVNMRIIKKRNRRGLIYD